MLGVHLQKTWSKSKKHLRELLNMEEFIKKKLTL